MESPEYADRAWFEYWREEHGWPMVPQEILDAAAELIREAERLAAMTGWPTRGSLATAAECLALIRRRAAVIQSLLSIVQPMGRGGTMPSAVVVLQTP